MQSFHLGDSARADDRSAWKRFFARLEGCAALEAPWTLVLQDPLANSFVSSVVDDPRDDPRMTIEVRTILSCFLVNVDMQWSAGRLCLCSPTFR